MINCATTGLETYVPSAETPWDAGRVQHLYRRIGYGATPTELETALAAGPEATAQRLLNEAVAQAPIPEPEWAFWNFEAFEAAELDPFETVVDYYYEFLDRAQQYGVREKMSLFWHNLLVTQYESHSCPSYQYQYLKVIDDHVFGNFKQLMKDMTKTPAMLFFLNGFENTRENPNENYGRELFELFTLGENNGYTEEDVVEASRALTGWNGWTSYCGEVEWAEWGFDDTDKTVFGVTGNFDYITLIDMLFEERTELIAEFICGRFYDFFVNRAHDEEVVSAMAATLIANDFEILPVFRQLFASAHFFDDANVGVLVKDPMELMTSFLRQGEFGDFENRQEWGFWSMSQMGQALGNPPDVAGWQGDRSWIDSNRITLRWEFIDGYSWAVHNESEETLKNFAKALADNSNSPEIIARAVVDYFVPLGLVSDEAYTTATDALKWNVPSNYYDTGEWTLDWPSASWQVAVLLQHIGRMPEFQLN